MTGIEGVGRPGPLNAARRAPTRAGFVVLEHARSSHGVAPPAPAAQLSPMLALQEMHSEAVADREARRHGGEMLAALSDLQRALLTGGDAPTTLQRLAELADSVPLAADPRLAALVSAVLVRVRVELARRHA